MEEPLQSVVTLARVVAAVWHEGFETGRDNPLDGQPPEKSP